jgi:hypothetical protein
VRRRGEEWLAVALYVGVLLVTCGALVFGGVGVIRAAAPLLRSAYRAQVVHAYEPLAATVIGRGAVSFAEADRARGRKQGHRTMRLRLRYLSGGQVRDAALELEVPDTAARILEFERTFGSLHEGSSVRILGDDAYPLEPVPDDASLPGLGALIAGSFGVLFGSFLVALMPALLLLGIVPAKR